MTHKRVAVRCEAMGRVREALPELSPKGGSGAPVIALAFYKPLRLCSRVRSEIRWYHERVLVLMF